MPASRAPEQVSQLGDKRRAVEPLVSTRGMLGEGGIFTRSEVGEAGRGLVKTREDALHWRLHPALGSSMRRRQLRTKSSSMRRRQLRNQSSSTRWRRRQPRNPGLLYASAPSSNPRLLYTSAQTSQPRAPLCVGANHYQCAHTRRRQPRTKSSSTRRRQPHTKAVPNVDANPCQNQPLQMGAKHLPKTRPRNWTAMHRRGNQEGLINALFR
jgi:hypothetical protein